jgi:uncharacterized protein YqeY
MLKQRILDDIKVAMKGGDKPRLGVLRLISAAIKQREVDERIELNDTQVLAVLEKMLKQRRESIAQYQAANRTDLVAQEEFEVGILHEFMPQPFSNEEIEAMIAKAIADSGASTIKDMGKVVGQLKGPMLGRADMAQVSALVKQKLTDA